MHLMDSPWNICLECYQAYQNEEIFVQHQFSCIQSIRQHLTTLVLTEKQLQPVVVLVRSWTGFDKGNWGSSVGKCRHSFVDDIKLNSLKPVVKLSRLTSIRQLRRSTSAHAHIDVLDSLKSEAAEDRDLYLCRDRCDTEELHQSLSKGTRIPIVGIKFEPVAVVCDDENDDPGGVDIIDSVPNSPIGSTSECYDIVYISSRHEDECDESSGTDEYETDEYDEVNIIEDEDSNNAADVFSDEGEIELLDISEESTTVRKSNDEKTEHISIPKPSTDTAVTLKKALPISILPFYPHVVEDSDTSDEDGGGETKEDDGQVSNDNDSSSDEFDDVPRRCRKKNSKTNSDTTTPSICSHCVEEFPTRNELNKHKSQFHPTTNRHLFECPICLVSFVHHKGLFSHLNSKHTQAERKTLENRKNWAEAKNKNRIRNKVRCKICAKELAVTSLQHHLRSHRNPCTECGRLFQSTRLLKDHMNIHNGINPYLCQQCGLQFPTKVLLQKHENAVHAQGQQCAAPTKDIQCELCGKCIKGGGSNFRQHMLTHGNNRLGLCSICGKRFKSAKHLKVHLLIHSNERAFECSVCKLRFKTKAVLRSHRRTHEPTTGQWNCKPCDKIFKSIWTLRRHKIVVHVGRRWSCTICAVDFASTYGLKKHQLKQHNSKASNVNQKKDSYVCQICDMKLPPRPRYLRRHMEECHNGVNK